MHRTPGGIATPRRAMAMGAVAALAVVAAVGALSLLAAAALDDRERAFTVGLPAVRIAAEIPPGQGTCREGIDVPAGFSRVRLATASFRRPGPPLTVTVGAAQGRIGGGYPDNSTVEVRVGDVPAGGRVKVCVSNNGDHRVALLGSPPDAAPYQLAQPSFTPAIGIAFVRDEPRSMLSLVPDVFERASRFRPEWVGPWTFWILLGLVAAGVPALLARAYRSAVSDPG